MSRWALASLLACGAPLARAADTVETAAFIGEAKTFVAGEVAAHVHAVASLDPPPALVLGVPTTGDFTWGSFMRAIAEARVLAGPSAGDRPRFLGELGLIEARRGSKTFSQLGAAITLRSFGSDLRRNALWQSLSAAEQQEWRSLLDPGRFYDRVNRKVINLPENYLGVASRIVAINVELGLLSDRALADEVLDRAAEPFTGDAVYTDDLPPTGRYDRYSQEYARFVYEAAEILGRQDVQQRVSPALVAVMRTWWDLASPDGYGYPWGRTIGAIGYMDTLDIIGFLARHPQFRPAPLPDLFSLYRAAWQWLQHDYARDRHLLDMFGFGRGNYAYMTPERQWQQTSSFLAKAAGSLALLEAAVRAEAASTAPATPRLPAVARFEWFRRGDRPAGVWLVRQGPLRFALPFTTGTAPGISDYLPAPHGLPGFAVPVERKVPALVPYLELADGRTLVAGDGADEIHPAADGRGVRAVWRRWAVVDDKEASGTTAAQRLVTGPMALAEPGLVAEVTWALDGGSLVRRERIRATQPVEVHRIHVAFPTTADRVATRLEGGRRVDRFTSPQAAFELAVEETTVPLSVSLEATADSALGRGARGHIPMLLHLEARGIRIDPAHPLAWTLRLGP